MANEFYKELIDNERTFRNNLGWTGSEVSGNSFYQELIALRAQITALWNLVGIADGQSVKWNNSTKKFVPGDFAIGSHTHPYLAIASNLSDLNNAATARGNLGLGSAATASASSFLATANNLSDLGSASTARGNLGLGSTGTAAYFWAGPTGAGGTAVFRAIAMTDLPSNIVRAGAAPTITGQALFWNNSTQQWDLKLMGVSATVSVTITSGNTNSSAFSLTKPLIFAFAPSTASTRTIKIQYTEDGGTTWVDTGISFDTVTSSPGTKIDSDTFSKIAGLTGVDSSGNGLANLRLSMSSSLGADLTIKFRSTSIGY